MLLNQYHIITQRASLGCTPACNITAITKQTHLRAGHRQHNSEVQMLDESCLAVNLHAGMLMLGDTKYLSISAM